jgi:class 3 adenylate cyclase/predicted ATPase
MLPISEWLQALGLNQYAQVFSDNDIDLELIPRLSEQDLKELGVSSMGHRKKLLKAIEELGGSTVAAPDATVQTAAQSSPEIAPSLPADAGERRQLTVMFCDMVGSTALSQKLDPETLRELMRSYQQRCGAVIDKYEGHVAQYLGDGLMVYFGWPRAHEDDAERAIRAGLEIVEAVKQVQAAEPLCVRVGIATGPVVVGETGAGDASVPKVAVGETPNLAARIQGLAETDQIIIGPDTRHLVGGTFDLDDFGEHALKGIVEPVHAWQVTGLARSKGRFEAAHGKAELSPLVGRDEELSLVMRRWEQAKEGEGQVVLLSGEPGIGKSRMIQALYERVADEPHIRLRYQCSPYHVNTALHPVIEQFERAAGFSRGDSTVQKLDKLEAVLGQGTTGIAEIGPLFAALLSLDAGERYTSLAMTPQQQKEETLKALADQLLALADREPVLMLFEDAHWIDPTTQEVLDLLVPMIASRRVLLVLTHRPGYQSQWSGHGHALTLTLTRLGRSQAGALVAKVTGDAPLPDVVLNQIVAKADGVPLFVEELTKTVIESGLLARGATGFEITSEQSSLAIPSTLQDSLMARLDRLPATVKEFAQIGACIGRVFDYALIVAVVPLRDEELDVALQQLVASEVILRKGKPPEANYSFRHSLLQDVAHESLLKSKRQQLHTRIAEALEHQLQETDENAPELLAHHYSAAGLAEQAAGYWLEAGRRAARHSADKEALAHFKAGLAQVETLPDGPTRYAIELDLQTAMGMLLIAITGPGSPEIEAAFSRTVTLSAKLDDPGRLSAALWGQAVAVYIRGEIGRSIDLTEEILKRAEKMDNAFLTVVGPRSLGAQLQMIGNFSSAREKLESAIRLYRPDVHASLALKYGHDPLAAGQSSLSAVVWALGYPDQAMSLSRQSIDNARRIEHPHTLAMVLNYAGWIRYFLRDPPGLQSHAEEFIAVSGENNFPVWLATAKVLRGNALASQGTAMDGVAMIQEGLQDYRALGGVLTMPYLLSLLAEAQLQCGQSDTALRQLDNALAIARGGDEHWWMSELLRRRGEMLEASTGQTEEAEACMKEAIATAVSQQAKSLELRAATSLARLWQGRGKGKEAHDLLVPVYDWFTEGFDTKDLKEAKALLDELES